MEQEEYEMKQRKRLAKLVQRAIGGKYTTHLRQAQAMPFPKVLEEIESWKTNKPKDS